MRRNNSQLLWFDGISAERSNTDRYNAWGDNEPSAGIDENCAYLGGDKKWTDNPCDYNSWNTAPFVLCQKARL